MAKIRFTDGRLGKPPAKTFQETVTLPTLKQEVRRFKYFCWIDKAHAVMLYETGIIPLSPAQKILSSLKKMEKEGKENFHFDTDFGSFLFQVENYLTDHAGEDAAGRLHTARGRADYQAASSTLHVRDTILQLSKKILNLQKVLVELGNKYAKTMMPGYTHLQHAQPTTFGHYILSHYYPLQRDFDRLKCLYKHSNKSTLGNCSRVGTTWPINRQRVADLLGHEGLVENAQDQSYYRRDHLAEFASFASILANNLARLATDLDVWYSEEFGMIDIPADYSGSSSIMPQKKNPYPMEKCRAVSGESIGWIASALGIFKVPHTSAADPALSIVAEGRLFEDVLESVGGMLRLYAEFLPKITIKEKRMKEMTYGKWNIAANLSDTIARKTGMPFRKAHSIVGRLVRECVDNDIPPSGVKTQLLDKIAHEMIGHTLNLDEDVIKKALDPWEFILSLQGIGSANPEVVLQTAADALKQIDQETDWLMNEEEKIYKAQSELEKAINIILNKEVS